MAKPFFWMILFSRSIASVLEGSCRSLSDGRIQEFASGQWQDLGFTSEYTCSNGVVSSTDHEVKNRTVQIPSTGPGLTGYEFCEGISPMAMVKNNTYGAATYKPGGRMASTYIAGPDASFRCNLPAPDDGFYVAVWTRYSPGVSQPQPKNCNSTLSLRNPTTGRRANALVIDRCASCVGVNHQTSDPTTPDYVVNGATVDLSTALWNYLYNDAPYGVYDIEYDGPVYGGSWDGDPDPLISPDCNP
ncbi:hypothetical protein M433DRAFT_177982 [Acidomyces richmondensis BFW]|nr:hypothetical protein M433DRAFT_177982 [Acidomyces richmondensis BFW]